MGYVGKASLVNSVHILVNAAHLARIALFGPHAATKPPILPEVFHVEHFTSGNNVQPINCLTAFQPN